MNDYDELLSSVKELAVGLQALHRLAVEQLTPVVEGILRSRSRDVRHIEQMLDRLLDHCGYEQAVLLYRRLCRHYWEIDPMATVAYVNTYREIWDTPDEPSEWLIEQALPLDIAPLPEHEIKPGDILMSHGNARDLVGMATLVKQVRPRLLLCDLLYRFHAQRESVEP